MQAVTRPLDATVDLNDIAAGDGALFVRDGVGIAARGVAARVPVSEVAEVLAAIDHDDGVGGIAPIALGCIPFEPGAPADLVIPSVLVGKADDGRQWTTTIDGADLDLAPAPRPLPSAAEFTVGASAPVEQYLAAVRSARDAVREGRIAKAVIAREVMVRSDRPIDVHAVLLRLRASFGSSYRYSIDGFIGASPELLVRVAGSTVESHPLAGTAPRRLSFRPSLPLPSTLLASRIFADHAE